MKATLIGGREEGNGGGGNGTDKSKLPKGTPKTYISNFQSSVQRVDGGGGGGDMRGTNLKSWKNRQKDIFFWSDDQVQRG